MKSDYIRIKNARIHNLKGIDVSIPKHRLTVITGVSGSGKSSLAFDTLYEEGKRRYLMFSDTQFMIDTVPGFDSITGLSPTVAVEQRIIRQSNPRSTVGTRIKISQMLAALFTNYGERDPAYDDGLPLDISMFQRGSARGMCVRCLGKGIASFINEDAMFADQNQLICDVACGLGRRGSTRNMLLEFGTKYGFDLWNSRIGDLTAEQLALLKYGDHGKSKFPGMIPWITMLTNGALSTSGRFGSILTENGMMMRRTCPKCCGTGLGEQAAHTTFHGKTITELENMYIRDLHKFFSAHDDGSNPLLAELCTKLSCMIEVGLFHLALSRPIPTLSGGELQRLFLASYIITEMDSIIFVFDEPTIGLHETEKENLIRIIRRLVDNGNTVVAVEHDENFMREADYIIDIGPDAGVSGGRKIYEGGFPEFLKCQGSRTAPYLTAEKGFPVKTAFRPVNRKKQLVLSHANIHNLRDVSTALPLGIMVGIAGVSGSGKSSLISDTLVPKLKEALKSKCVTGEAGSEPDGAAAKRDDQVENTPGAEEACDTAGLAEAASTALSGTVTSSQSGAPSTSLSGVEALRRCYVIDQRPIGRSRTSCPATYTGIFDRIRAMFAETETARERGYTAGMFSVNSTGGCQRCKGDGVIHYHVGFGNFIDITCDDCGGTGYVPEAMEVLLEGKNIRDILEMSVDEAKEFFADKDKTIDQLLGILKRVGMGYIQLGQATPTISGGESQRIKLAKELAKGKNTKDVLYILDEPTTGLSFSDSKRLLQLLDELVQQGASIIVTEHDPYILSNCDYILELGPGGGTNGGTVIAQGTPAELRKNPSSVIGRYLKTPAGSPE
ncbi:MAG: ABC transporter [Lachnospiraceae bacterium]|nr:ABC transporter [Lachnospiraceae bacterium]